MLTRTWLCAASVAAVVLSSPMASAQERVKVGALRCSVAPGMGLILMSERDMSCVFVSRNGHVEHYAGSLEKLGLNIGFTDAGYLVWDVFAPTARPYRGDLAGDYEGVGASLPFGGGVGANAMVGGNARSFELQPVSVQTHTGANISGGVATINLRSFR